MPVLIVEDDRRLAVSLRRSLIESRMAVDLAHDSEEGLAGYLSIPCSSVSFERARLRAESIGLVFQSGNLIPFLTALENVELVAGGA